MRASIIFMMMGLSILFLSQNVIANDVMTYDNMKTTVGKQYSLEKESGPYEQRSSLYGERTKQEVQFNQVYSKNQKDLNDLSGEISISEGGYKNQAYIGAIIDIYQYVDICYSGPEDVNYTIKVNDNVLDQYTAQWVDSIGGFRVYLEDLLLLYGSYMYSISCYFEVEVRAEGYNDLSARYNTFFSYVPASPIILGSDLTVDALIVYVEYEYSIYGCNLHAAFDDDSNLYYSYRAERLDEDYYVTVCAYNKTPMSTVYGFVEETFFVPARLYGDVDGNEYVSIKDLSILIDYILLGYSYYDFYEGNADLNCDELITIDDVALLIDKLLVGH